MNPDIQKRFHEAVRNNDIETARRMIAAGADVNASYEMQYQLCGRTESYKTRPIFQASSEEHPDMLRLLIEAGADVNIRNEDDSTPLMEYNMYCYEGVKLLLDAGAKVNVRNKYGQSPLLVATLSCNPDVIELLLDAGAYVNVLGAEDRESPYETAVVERDFMANEGAEDCISLLTEAGAIRNNELDIEDCPTLSPQDYAFLRAVQNREADRIMAALDAGADINATDRYGSYAVKQAVAHDDLELCKLLVDRGVSAAAVAQALEWPWMPLCNNHLELIDYLLSQLNGEIAEKAKENVLTSAVNNGCVEAVRRLLRDGVNPNGIGLHQQPLLMNTVDAWENKVEIAQLLLDAGANLNYVDEDGWNVLLLATARGIAELAIFLLKNGADYRHQNKLGMSAYSRSRDYPGLAEAFDKIVTERGAAAPLLPN